MELHDFGMALSAAAASCHVHMDCKHMHAPGYRQLHQLIGSSYPRSGGMHNMAAVMASARLAVFLSGSQVLYLDAKLVTLLQSNPLHLVLQLSPSIVL